jgi:hypothetical protein
MHDCDYAPEHGQIGKSIRPLIGQQDIGERTWDEDIKYAKEYFPIKFVCHTGPPTLLASDKFPCTDIQIDFAQTEIIL